MTERVAYDEFSMFHENATEFGIPYDGPPTVRRERVEVAPGRHLSALVWGVGTPEFVLLHGGGQNAHTWDTVALALGRPLIAIDLAGHGHSDPIPDGSALDYTTGASDVAAVVRALAPVARAVAGMSLGGITTLALYDHAPELVRRIALVDITPGVTGTKSAAISAFINGPAGFESFDDILARTIEHNPTRTVSSLRRGVLHNAVQLEDGTWVWRYARGRGLERGDDDGSFPKFAALWDVVSTVRVPLMLARGMRSQSVVDDADEAELVRRCPQARIEHFEQAGHSIQGDTPVELAAALADFAGVTIG
jgi:pimeloyl-ACP methyl ester carboxylesterase